jgi:hypothetical protein
MQKVVKNLKFIVYITCKYHPDLEATSSIRKMMLYEAKIILKLLSMDHVSLLKHFTLAARTFERTKITSLYEGQAESIRIDTGPNVLYPKKPELVQKSEIVSQSGVSFFVYNITLDIMLKYQLIK